MSNQLHSNLLDIQAFDKASRGPLGASQFLWSLQSAHFVSYIGCMITIVALAFESFYEQLLSFEQLDTQQSGLQSSVLRSHVYDLNATGTTGGVSLNIHM